MSNLSQPWAILFGLQANANDVLAGPNWRIDPTTYDYKAALMDEAVEARLAAGYAPFWSGGAKPAFDASNLKLELVDILHFLISEVLQGSTEPVEEILRDLNTSFTRGFVNGTAEGSWNPEHIYRMLGELYLKSGSLSAPYWPGAAVYNLGAACGNANMSFPELYGKYIAKNALNVFRKSIGYKQDKSVKFWVNNLTDDSADKIEDNVFVMAKVDEMVANGEDLLNITYDQMVEIIGAEYTRVTGKAVI